MASLGHVAVGLAAARWEATRVRPLFASTLPSMAAYAALSLLPDADVLGLRLGVPYGATWGHRGATHSLAFALAASLLVAALATRFSRPFLRTFLLALAEVGSHDLHVDVDVDGDGDVEGGGRSGSAGDRPIGGASTSHVARRRQHQRQRGGRRCRWRR